MMSRHPYQHASSQVPVDLACGCHASHGEAAGDALGEQQHVGAALGKVLVAPPLARAPHTRLHLQRGSREMAELWRRSCGPGTSGSWLANKLCWHCGLSRQHAWPLQPEIGNDSNPVLCRC